MASCIIMGREDDAETKATLAEDTHVTYTSGPAHTHTAVYAWTYLTNTTLYADERFGLVLAGIVGLLEHGGLRDGGGLGCEPDGDAVLDLLRAVGVLVGGDGVEVGGGALAEEVAVAVGAGVAQRVLQRLHLAPEEGAAHVAQGAEDAAQRPDARDDRVRVALPVAARTYVCTQQISSTYFCSCRCMTNS